MNVIILTTTTDNQDLVWPRPDSIEHIRIKSDGGIAKVPAPRMRSRLEAQYVGDMEVVIQGMLYHISESHGRLLIHTTQAGQKIIIKPPHEDGLIVTTATTLEG